MQKYCQKIHGHFGLSFPSRANVVKVTHLNVTGSEALISWASGIKANVPWRFKWHNVSDPDPPWSHLRFPRLSKCQESTVQDMDCDEAFGGYATEVMALDAPQCDPGSVFVKNITEKTITNRSAVQHCVPCPGRRKDMQCHCYPDVAGLLGKKKVVEQTKFAHFCTFFCLNLRPIWMSQANFVRFAEWLWLRHDAPTEEHQQGLAVPKFPCLWRRQSLFKRIDPRNVALKAWMETCASIFVQFVKLYDWGIKAHALVPGYEDVGCMPNARMIVRRSNSNVFICLKCASWLCALCSEEMWRISRWTWWSCIGRDCRLLQGHSVASDMCISRTQWFQAKGTWWKVKDYFPFLCKRCCDFHRFSGVLAALWTVISVVSSRRSSVDSRSFVTVVRRLCLRLASSVLAGKTKIEPCHCTKHIKSGCHERQATFQNATRQKSRTAPLDDFLELTCSESKQLSVDIELLWVAESMLQLWTWRVWLNWLSNSYLYLSYKVIVMICKCKWNFIMLSYRDYIYVVYTMYINHLQVIRTSEVLSTSTSSWHSLPWRRQRWWHWEIQPRSSTSSKGSSKFSPSSLSLFRPATLHTIDLHFVFHSLYLNSYRGIAGWCGGLLKSMMKWNL